MFLFGITFLPAAILFVITGMVDRFFIKHYLDLTQVGIYGAGYKIASIVSIVVLAFNLNWQPYYLKHYNNSSFIKNVEDISKNFLIMEYIEGEKFSNWIGMLKGSGSVKKLKSTIKSALEDCYRLDQIGFDHGELSNISKHVIQIK